MQVHGLVTFLASARFNKARATALDLDTTASFLLNVLHIRTTLSNYLGAQVESGNRFEVDRDALIGPFTLNVGLAEPRFYTREGSS